MPRMTKARLEELRAFIDDKPASYDWGRMEEALDEIEACWKELEWLKDNTYLIRLKRR